MNKLLLKALGASWLAFLIIGIVIKFCFAAPTITLLINRSYCAQTEWAQVAQTYRELYTRHQHKTLRLQSVVVFSDFDEAVFESPPLPTIVENLNIYGQFDPHRQKLLQQRYGQTQVIGCHSMKDFNHGVSADSMGKLGKISHKQ
ncbi:MAG: hypothetical protein HC800_17205 [Phormidesmis sp. RL_2_1]|nr:hypothetical protein [Phormidesmis sp. RL_2_1]